MRDFGCRLWAPKVRSRAWLAVEERRRRLWLGMSWNFVADYPDVVRQVLDSPAGSNDRIFNTIELSESYTLSVRLLSIGL